MTPTELVNAAKDHARTGRIDYAVYVGRCMLCEATMTWMESEFRGSPEYFWHHACDVGERRHRSEMPLTGRRGNITTLGHLRLSEDEFLECRDIAMEALGTKKGAP